MKRSNSKQMIPLTAGFLSFILHLNIHPQTTASFSIQYKPGETNVKVQQNFLQSFPRRQLNAATTLPMDETTSLEPITSNLQHEHDESSHIDYQTIAEEIASSFHHIEFNPAPFARNNHFQTIASSFLRDRPQFAYWPGDFTVAMRHFMLDKPNESGMGLDWYDDRERVETPDHDFFHIDYKYTPSESRGTVFILHGLESNAESPLTIDMARSYLQQGFDVACVNFRGCSGENNDNPGEYHLGFTDDLKFAIDKFRAENESVGLNKPIYLSGFSLGANVVVKLLGELGEDAQKKYNIQGAAVASVPFDLVKSAYSLGAPGINKSIYTPIFIKSIQDRVRAKHEEEYLKCREQSLPFHFDYEGLMEATTMNELDNAYIAPLYGYRNFLDYYDQNASGQYVSKIAVPLLAINAKDDPFFHPGMSIPDISPNPLRFSNPEYGGHTGFMFHESHDTEGEVPSTSWMPHELSRFVDHADRHHVLFKAMGIIYKTCKIISARQQSRILTNKIQKQNEIVAIDRNEKAKGASNYVTSRRLASHQTRAELIASSFEALEFTPASFAQNRHFQTIIAAFLRDRPQFAYWSGDSTSAITSLMFDIGNDSGMGLDWYDKRERIETPDHDFFHVDFKYATFEEKMQESRGMVVILHGLESNAESPLTIDMARSYLNQGFDVACVNFRGCSGEVNSQPGQYHIGFTDDLKQTLEKFRNEADIIDPKKPIYLSGFSLGANVVVKLLGELGEDALNRYNIQGAAVASVPFDLVKSADVLTKPGINKSIYTPRLVQSMKDKAREKYEEEYLKCREQSLPFHFDYEGLMEATTINQVEDAYIAKVYGYRNFLDYYDQNASGQYVSKIAVPLLAINAKDDPFFHPGMSIPDISPNPLRFSNPEYGGHTGFMFHESHDTEGEVPSTSWMPHELSRFVDHADRHHVLFKAMGIIYKAHIPSIIRSHILNHADQHCNHMTIEDINDSPADTSLKAAGIINYLKKQRQLNNQSVAEQITSSFQAMILLSSINNMANLKP